MKDTEVEIQVEIENIKPLLNLLKSKGRLLYKEKQIDQYYTPLHRDFRKKEPIEEWLRLRNSNGKFSLTYKNWYRSADKKTHHCDEYESDLGKIDQLEKIFKVLDFRPVVRVEKLRQAYKFGNYEIAVDKVKDLGDFIEIEYKGKSKKSPKELTAEMVKFLKGLGLGSIRRNFVGYAYKRLYPHKDHLEEKF